MKKIIITLILLLPIIACSNYKRITFKTATFMTASKVFEFELSLPRGYTKSYTDITQQLLKKYQYRDSAVLYLSLDISYANSPNWRNWIKCSRPNEKFKCEEGQQENGKYWKEIESNNLVIGYYDVHEADKAKFDEAIKSLRLIK